MVVGEGVIEVEQDEVEQRVVQGAELEVEVTRIVPGPLSAIRQTPFLSPDAISMCLRFELSSILLRCL